MKRIVNLMLWTVAVMVMPGVALAADGSGGSSGAAIGAGIAMGLAVLGGGIGQGLTAGNTTAGIARNPGSRGEVFVSFVLGMAFVESIVLFAFVIAFMLQGKA